MKIEKLLKIASDSNNFGSFNDGLSMMIESEKRKMNRRLLSDDELDLVAGGAAPDTEMIEHIKKTVLRNE